MLFDKPYIPSAELNQYLKELGDNIIGCEIGVCWAENLCHMLECCDNIKKVIAIDPFIEFQDYAGYVKSDDIVGWKELALSNIDSIGAADRVDFKIMTSDDAVSLIEDHSLDFIFIDGNHSQEYVRKDIRNYYDKVKVGGIFAGHDYSMSSVSTELHLFLEEKNIPSTSLRLLQNDSWMLYKV